MALLRALNRMRVVWYTRVAAWGYLRYFWRLIWRHRAGANEASPSLREYLNFVRLDLLQLYQTKKAGLAGCDAEGNPVVMLENSFIRGVLEQVAANERAQDQYAVQPYAGRVTLVRARHDPYSQGCPDPTVGWKDIAQEGVDVHIIEGSHLTLCSEPYVSSLASVLQDCLDSVAN